MQVVDHRNKIVHYSDSIDCKSGDLLIKRILYAICTPRVLISYNTTEHHSQQHIHGEPVSQGDRWRVQWEWVESEALIYKLLLGKLQLIAHIRTSLSKGIHLTVESFFFFFAKHTCMYIGSTSQYSPDYTQVQYSCTYRPC